MPKIPSSGPFKNIICLFRLFGKKSILAIFYPLLSTKREGMISRLNMGGCQNPKAKRGEKYEKSSKVGKSFPKRIKKKYALQGSVWDLVFEQSGLKISILRYLAYFQ